MNLAEDFPAEVQPLHLYMPVPLDSDVSSARAPRLSANDMETLMLFRNLFAFLIGQSLVATPRYPNLFSVFLEIATLLKRFEFSNLDGSNLERCRCPVSQNIVMSYNWPMSGRA